MSSSDQRAGLSGEWTFDGMQGGASAFGREGLFAEGQDSKWIDEIDGDSAATFRLDQDGGAVRNEVVPVDLGDGFDQGTHAQLGSTAWYGMRSWMPDDWAQRDGSMDILMQWVAQPDFDRGEGWRHPVVALGTTPEKDGTHFFLAIRADDEGVTGKGDYDQARQIDLGRIDDSIGGWTDWVFKIGWDAGSDGALQLWKNGEMVVDLQGIGTAYADDLGPYFKFGLYKWPWGGGGDTGVESRSVSFDDVRIAAGDGAGLSSVTPDAAGYDATQDAGAYRDMAEVW